MNDNDIIAADKEEAVNEYKFGDNMGRRSNKAMWIESLEKDESVGFYLDYEKFAELVRADERKVCERLCEEIEVGENSVFEVSADAESKARSLGAAMCVERIRAEGTE